MEAAQLEGFLAVRHLDRFPGAAPIERSAQARSLDVVALIDAGVHFAHRSTRRGAGEIYNQVDVPERSLSNRGS